MCGLHRQLIRCGFASWRAVSAGGRALRSLERSQWLDPEQLAARQWQRLTRLLQHAYDTVPYYRQMFDGAGATPADIRTAADMRRLPTIDKTTINLDGERLVSSRRSRRQLIPNETGGSTGLPMRFYQDRRYWAWARAGQFRAYRMTGWRPGDRWAFIWGSPWDGMKQTGWRRFPNRILGNLVWINAYCITEAQLLAGVSLLSRFKPKLLVGYASSLAMLCRFIRENGLDGRLRVPAVMPSAETLLPQDRALLEEVLGGEVYNRYGTRECSIIAQECREHGGLHLWSETNYMEVLCGDRPADAGSPGRVVITTLTNEAMPLIRYEVDDVAIRANGVCACGRGLPLLQQVTGRVYEHLIMPSGKLVGGGAVTQLLYKHEGIRQYEAVQSTPGAVTIRLVPVPGTDCRKLTQFVRQVFRTRLERNLEVDVEFCDAINPGASGKYSYVRSQVVPAFARRNGSSDEEE